MRSSLVGLQLLLACLLVWGTSVAPAEPNAEEPGKEEKKPSVPEDPELDELEERAKEYRERMQRESGSPFEFMMVKEKALDYFHKRHGAFYRPIEDLDIKAKYTPGIMVRYTQYLVNTNCTQEEGRRLSSSWDDFLHHRKSIPCVALPKREQKKLKCRVETFLEAGSNHPTVVRQDCEPVVFLEESDNRRELSAALNYLLSEMSF